MTDVKRHAAFLVRWQEGSDQAHWRSTIENAYTGEKHHFNDRNELLQFLWRSLFENGNNLPDGKETTDTGEKAGACSVSLTLDAIPVQSDSANDGGGITMRGEDLTVHNNKPDLTDATQEHGCS